MVAARGFRCLVPTWPLGAHRPAMRAGADLSPRGVASLVSELMHRMDLDDVTLVGNDTGGAICQFVVDASPDRVGRLVLTNCDGFEIFPPFPFGLLFRIARHPRFARPLLALTRSARVRNGVLGFGLLVRRRLSAGESLPWVSSYLQDAGVRRDVATFARAARAADLAEVGSRLGAFRDRSCSAGRPRTGSSGSRWRTGCRPPSRQRGSSRSRGARTFVPLDQPSPARGGDRLVRRVNPIVRYGRTVRALVPCVADYRSVSPDDGTRVRRWRR
ncbi:alpha/beta fold hydrolase [Nocardioides sp.]|uniref:alpha/beta fold hydrolase n=1 Tax=Nocardioides sp. TaxID=35761 RepID=UPI003528344D